MKKLKSFFVLFTVASLLSVMTVSQLAFAQSGNFGQNVQEELENVSVDQFLSAEYILLTEYQEYWRLGLVSVEVDEMELVGGLFYTKGQVGPYVDSFVLGDASVNEDSTVVNFNGQWYWDGLPAGDLVIDFWETSAGTVAGEGHWTNYDDGDQVDFVIAESGRSMYAEKEVEEIMTHIQACAEGAEACSVGQNPEELTPETVFDGEYLMVDASGQTMRFALAYVSDEELAEYGLSPTYNSAGGFWKKGEVPQPDGVFLGNSYLTEGGTTLFEDYVGDLDVSQIKVLQTLVFEGAWFYVEDAADAVYQDYSSGSEMYVMDDLEDYGGEFHVNFRQVVYDTLENGNIIYGVTCDGYWTSKGYSHQFMCGETARSRYAKHELEEFEDMVYEYLAEVDDATLEETEEMLTEDPTVEDESSTEVEEAAEIEADASETSQEEYVEETYDDVPQDVWYSQYIDSEYWQGSVCVNGKGQCFNGDQPVLRAHAAKLVRAVLDKRGLVGEVKSCVSKYKDVPQDEWFTEPVCAMTSLGIMTGNPDGSFEPGQKLNRAQAATVLARALGGEVMLLSYYEDVLGNACPASTFADLTDPAAWYYDTARLIGCMGIITGVEGDDGQMYFKPNDVVNRSQFAAMLARAVQYNANAYKSDLYPVATDGTYPYLVVVSQLGATMDSCDPYPGPDVESVTIVDQEGVLHYLGTSVGWMLKNDNPCNLHKGVQAMMYAPDYGYRGSLGYTSMGYGFAIFEVDVDLATDVDGIVVAEEGETVESVKLYAAADPGNPATWIYLGMDSVGDLDTTIEDGGVAE